MSDLQAPAVAATVTRLWQELHGIDGIDEDDGFFELGGDSIVAARLVGRVRKELGVDVSLVVIFDNVTLKQLIAHTEGLVSRRD
jgi:acyl carrier protein